METLFQEQEQEGGACREDAAPGSAGVPLPKTATAPRPSDPLRNPGAPQYRAKNYPHGSTVHAHSGPNAGRSGTVIAHKNSHTLTIRWDLSSTTEQP